MEAVDALLDARTAPLSPEMEQASEFAEMLLTRARDFGL
jgi:hypothetical protein